MSQPLLVIAGGQFDPVGIERAIGVLDFAEAGLGVWKGNYGKQAEATFVSAHEVSAVFVYPAGGACRRFAVTEPESGSGKRYDSGLHAILVHRFEGLLRSPGQIGRIHATAASSQDSLPIFHNEERRDDVMVGIDKTYPGGG